MKFGLNVQKTLEQSFNVSVFMQAFFFINISSFKPDTENKANFDIPLKYQIPNTKTYLSFKMPVGNPLIHQKIQQWIKQTTWGRCKTDREWRADVPPWSVVWRAQCAARLCQGIAHKPSTAALALSSPWPGPRRSLSEARLPTSPRSHRRGSASSPPMRSCQCSINQHCKKWVFEKAWPGFFGGRRFLGLNPGL